MEFCTKRELQNQTGHSVYDWPLVVLKELIDNALDACEEAEVAPVISITVEPGSITIQDNGGGIDADTIESILDYTIRVSSREAYVSPTRGAQGNALKTILAMGYVLDASASARLNNDAVGVTIIETRGVEHRIEFRVDHVNNQPKIIHTTTPSPIDAGTKITIKWPESELEWTEDSEFKQLAEAYVWFNPHLTLRGTWFGHAVHQRRGDQSQLGKMAAAQSDQRALVRRDAAAALSRRPCGQGPRPRPPVARCASSSPNFAGSPGPPSSARSSTRSAARTSRWRSSSASIRSTAPASPSCWQRCASTASRSPRSISASSAPSTSSSGSWRQAATSTRSNIRCARASTSDGIPYVIEFAFGLHQSGLTQGAAVSRKFVTGANWSVGISNPFRGFGSTGEGLESTLAQGARQRQPAGDLRRCTWPRPTSSSPTAAKARSSSPTTRSSPMTKNARPRNIANDMIDAVESRDQQMDAAEEVRGAASRHASAIASRA